MTDKNHKRFLKVAVSTALVASSITAAVTPSLASTFSDLDPQNTHYKNIINLLDRGIINGYPNGTYKPNAAITRGQAAKILAKTLNLDLTNIQNPNFEDIDKNHQYYPYIAALVQAGVISGYSDKTFKPTQTITRGQMAKMIANGFKLVGNTSTLPFMDVPVNHQYANSIAALYEAKITTGKTTTTFDLAGSVTRGQLASFVVRAEQSLANVEKKVTGSINSVQAESITIDNQTYSVHEDVAFLLAASNIDALNNAEVIFTTKNNEILAVTSLSLKHGSYFDGQNATIDQLKLPATLSVLKNVVADTITYSINSTATIDNVTAKTFIAEAANMTVASIANELPSINLIFNGSSIEILKIIGSIAAIQKTGSTITTLQAEQLTSLLLNGDFKNVVISPTVNLIGAAIIEALQFSNGNITNFKPSTTIQISNAIINGQSYTWNEVVTKFITPSTSTPESSSNSNNSNSSNSSENENSNTIDDLEEDDSPSSSENGNNIKPLPDTNEETNNTTQPTKLDASKISISEHFDILSGTTAVQDAGAEISVYHSNNELLGKSIIKLDGSFEVTLSTNDTAAITTITSGDTIKIVVDKNGEVVPGAEVELLWTIPNNSTGGTQPTTPPVVPPISPPASGSIAAQNIELNGNTIAFTNDETDEIISYTLADEQLQTFFSNNIDLLSNVRMAVQDGEVTGIIEATINTEANFDGSTLAGVSIETLNLSGAISAVENVTDVEYLNVSSDADTLVFNNVSADINATGSFQQIIGAAGDHLTISSTAANVLVSNVTSTNVTIDENNDVAHSLVGQRIASATNAFVFANETKMQITFSNGNYANQTLTVNRKDTVINVQGTPFSSIEIKNNNVDLLTYGAEINRLTVSNNVSYLALDADVLNFAVTLGQPLTIHSSSAKTIQNLAITVPATATETGGWLDLINVSINNLIVDNTVITDIAGHDLIKKAAQIPETTISTFSSALERTSFGKYKINMAALLTGEQYYYVSLKDANLLEKYKKLSTLTAINAATTQDNLTQATNYVLGTSFIYYADITDVVIYKIVGDDIQAVSVASPPTNTALVRLYDISEEGDLTYHTRFSDNQKPQDMLKTVYIFKSGSLAKEVNVTGDWVKENSLNTIVVKSGVSLPGIREVIIANNALSEYAGSPNDYPDDYVKIFKVIAKKAAEKGNPQLIERLLLHAFSKTEGTFDSFFLSKYVAAINTKATSLTSLSDFENLINEINSDNAYDPVKTMTASDLYLTGSIQTDFTYSVDGIITNSLNDKGELLFNAVQAGSTTVRMTDSTGLSTLVHVTVDANKEITQTVLATDAPAGTLLEGTANFRYDGSKLIATNFNKVESTFKKSAAIIQQSDSTLTRVMLLPNGTSYSLSAAATITPVTLSPSEFGLNEITNVFGENVGFKKLEDGTIMFYPRYEGSELILVTDGTNEVAINATTTTTITNLTNSIARSNELAIESDLNLLSVNDQVFTPNSPKNVFLYNNGSTIQAFAKDAFTGSVKLVDSANTITLVNLKATKVANKVTVNPLEIVKTSLAQLKDVNGNLLNENATVQHIDTPVVRANGLDLYAIGTGTATVTLSNGHQYLVTVNASSGVYTIEANAVENLNITAAELHMTNIKEVLGTTTVQYVKNNSEAIISLAAATEAIVTLLSTNNEKTVIKVTKAGSNYSYTPYRVEVASSDLGLSAITDVYNVGNTPAVSPARAKVDGGILYIYNTEVGNRTFRVSDGVKSTALNVAVTANGNGFTSTPIAVKHEIPNTFELADGATVAGNAAHLVGNVLYATGLELDSNNKAKIEVPLKNGANYVIGLIYNADTGLYSFDPAATVTFTFNYTKEELGLDTITTATTAGSNISTTVVDDQVKIAITADTSARVEVTGTSNGQTVKSFIYVTRTDSTTTAKIERAETSNAANELVALDLDLKGYGYTTTPTGTWTVANVARATISADFKANFYALNSGTTGFKLTDGNGKDLLINVTADANNPRGITATVVEEALSADLSLTGTIIEGDGVRLSTDGKTVYAAKVGATAKVKLSDDTYVLYEVTQNTDGQYVLTPTPLANITTVTAASLGLTGNITATNIDTTITTKTEYADSIVLTGIKDGTTAMLVTDAGGTSVLVNVTVAGSTVTATKVEPVQATSAPTLLPGESTSVIRIDGTNIFAIGEGTVRMLVDNEIHEVSVTKAANQYAITTPTAISKAVITATDLGFTANTAIEIETAANANFYVNQLDGKIVAYSKLTGNTTGSFEFVVKATDSGARTLVRLNDKGTALLEHKVAKEETVPFDNATAVTFNDAGLARFDAAADVLYVLQEGLTFVTANNRLHAVDITRDTDGYLQADVRQLLIEDATKTFAKITGTDENILDVTANAIYAKAIGTTKVKLGSDILTVTIGKDATGKYTMTPIVTTSQFIAVADADLTSFETAEVIAGTANSVALSLDATGLTIFSNGAATAQSLLVRVTDDAGQKAIINVTIDSTGAVSKAEVVKTTITTVSTATETIQTEKARGVWNGTSLTVYTLAAGNTALAFAKGLVNIQTTADGNKVNNPTVTMLDHSLANPEVVTNTSLMNDSYFTAEGTGLVYKDNKVYSVLISKVNDQYVKTISAGSPAATIDLTTIGGTFAESNSSLNSVKVLDPAATDKLVIYADGIGISDIAISTGSETFVYQTNVTATEVPTPIIAKAALAAEFTGATDKEGDSLRLAADTMYFLKEGATTLVKDNKLINALVTRDAQGFFTGTPVFVTAELKENYTGTQFVKDGTIIYATNNVTDETFFTENYRVTATTTATNGLYALTVDERHMNKFQHADYFISGAITVKAGGNTNANVARAEVVGDDLIIYAGDTFGSTMITFTNGTKDVTFNVVHGEDGKVITTPQAAVDSLKFADIGLSTTTNVITVSNEFDSTVAEVTATSTGLTVNALKAGTTSVTLEQNGAIVGFVNIKVETVSGNLKITTNAVSYEITDAQLMTTMANSPRTYDGKYYATATGKILYGTGANATSIVVTQNAATGLYNVTKSTHTLATITASDVDLDKITHISVNGSSVEAVYNADNTEMYIYGTNNGTSDVVVSNGSKYTTIVAANGATLVPTIARKQLDANDQLAGATWTTNFVDIRGNYIYVTHAGKGVATANLGVYNVLMNINVARKTDQTFDITYDVVDYNDFTSNVTILSGTSIKVDGSRIFAQQAGMSTIEVNGDVYTVDVTQTADGLYNIAVSEPIESATITSTDLGLTTLSSFTISAITGAGVIDAKIVNNQIILQAKFAGEAQVTVTDGTDSSIIHVLVENQNGELVLTPKIAKFTLASTPSELEKTAIATDGIFRTKDNILFALKEGSIITHINGELHKLTSTKVSNVLTPKADIITATLPDAVSGIESSTVLKVSAEDNTQVIATNFGTETVTVGGTRTFRLTVNNDGSIISEELVAHTFDLAGILNSTATELTTSSAIATIKYNGNTATIDPIKAGTQTMTISDGTNAIQVKITVVDNNGTLSVTTEIPSMKYYTGTIGFYPTAITMPNGAAFTSKQGVIKLANGEITVYPGEVGTAQLIIVGQNGQKGLYELTVKSDYSYTLAPYTQTVGYDAFKFRPTVFKKNGTALAKAGVTGLDISFEDERETLFVVKGDTENDYKILQVQAEIDTANNKFTAKTPVVYAAHVVTGEVSNVKGLQIATDGNTSILFADSSTTYPASYILDGVIYEVKASSDPAKQFVSDKLSVGLTPEKFVQGTEVIALKNTQWIAQSEGTGIYKTTTGDYETVTITGVGNTYTISQGTVLSKVVLDSGLTNVQVLAPSMNVYVDGTTVFGTSTEKIVVSAEKAGKKYLYTGDFASATVSELKEDLLQPLGWTTFTSNNLKADSTILRIEGSDIYGLAVGSEEITFTSPNGLKRKMNVTINQDYTISVTPVDKNIVTYSTTTPGNSTEEIVFTFALNVPENTNINVSGTVGDVSVDKNKLKIIIAQGTHGTTTTFTIVFPELGATPISFKVNTNDINDYKILNDPDSLLQFNIVQP